MTGQDPVLVTEGSGDQAETYYDSMVALAITTSVLGLLVLLLLFCIYQKKREDEDPVIQHKKMGSDYQGDNDPLMKQVSIQN